MTIKSYYTILVHTVLVLTIFMDAAMLKNITLSAEERLIRKAREKARRERTTLNDNFRRWLKQYVNANNGSKDYDILMKSLNYADSGKSFTRDEMNER